MIDVEPIVVHLKRKEVAMVPFDTCYGLICDGTDLEACNKLYQLKQRPRSKPSALIVKDINEIKKYADLSEKQEKFLEKLLPGKVTVILRLKENTKLPKNYIRTKYDTASFRIVDSELITNILTKFKKPLLATSANLSGNPVILSRVDYVMHPFNQARAARVLTVLDEVFERPSHSTLIDLTTDHPEIIRPGAVSTSEIMSFL